MKKQLAVLLFSIATSGCAIFNNERGTGNPEGLRETGLLANKMNIVNTTLKDKSWQGLKEEIEARAEDIARNEGYSYYAVTPLARDTQVIFNDFPAVDQRVFLNGISGAYSDFHRPIYVFEHDLKALSAQVEFYHSDQPGSNKVWIK